MEMERELSCWEVASLIWQGVALAKSGVGAADQVRMACTHCGATVRLDGRTGAAPELKERSPGSAVARPEPEQPRRS
eukprot:5620389-Pyramimonas_sp.AAC.1